MVEQPAGVGPGRPLTPPEHPGRDDAEVADRRAEIVAAGALGRVAGEINATRKTDRAQPQPRRQPPAHVFHSSREWIPGNLPGRRWHLQDIGTLGRLTSMG